MAMSDLDFVTTWRDSIVLTYLVVLGCEHEPRLCFTQPWPVHSILGSELVTSRQKQKICRFSDSGKPHGL